MTRWCEHAPRVVVIGHDGRERVASQVRRDPKSELALLVVHGKGLSQAEWGDSDLLEIGDWVLAVGHPAEASESVSAGIVSGKGRAFALASYDDLILTDAVINRGNSGGPLVNLRGEVVGICTAVRAGGEGNEGFGFAVPAARVRRIAADLAVAGHVRRSYLGVLLQPVDRAAAERLGQPGALVVAGVSARQPRRQRRPPPRRHRPEPGGQTGLQPEALQAAVEVAPTDKPLTLTIDRDGVRREVKVQPQLQPDTMGQPEFGPEGRFRAPGSPQPLEPQPRNPQDLEPPL